RAAAQVPFQGSLMKHAILRSAALLLGFLGWSMSALGAAPQPTHEFTLDNGLKVIVREDHRAPVVVSQLWYKVGSSYEQPGLTGLSHALEHMMFKGSEKLGPGESSRILRELGAEENAFTSDDYTAYYQVLARDRLAVAFELEADRLASLRLPPDEFAREIEVIQEERRLRTDDRPGSLAYERFKTLAYPASGYRTPTIGWMADLERMTVDDLRAWYERWPAPNNATLVAVGDVTRDHVERRARPDSRPRDQAGPTAAGTGRARRTAHHSAPADPAAVAADGLQRARPGHRGEPARRAGAAPDRRAARRRLQRPPGQPPGARRRAGERRLRLVQRPHSRRQPVRALRNAQRAAGPHPGAGGSRPVGTAGTAQ